MATNVSSIDGSTLSSPERRASRQGARAGRTVIAPIKKGPKARRFLVTARDRFGELERIAALASEELDADLVEAVEELRLSDPSESERLALLGESLVEHQRTVAERSGHMRRRLERRGGLAPAPPVVGRRAGDVAADAEAGAEAPPPPPQPDEPTEGVVLLVRQMAATGADDRQIVKVLSRLGVDNALEKVRRAHT